MGGEWRYFAFNQPVGLRLRAPRCIKTDKFSELETRADVVGYDGHFRSSPSDVMVRSSASPFNRFVGTGRFTTPLQSEWRCPYLDFVGGWDGEGPLVSQAVSALNKRVTKQQLRV